MNIREVEQTAEHKINYLDISVKNEEEGFPLLIKWDFPEDAPPFQVNISINNENSGELLRYHNIDNYLKKYEVEEDLGTGDYLVNVNSAKRLKLQAVPQRIHIEKTGTKKPSNRFPKPIAPASEVEITKDKLRFSWKCQPDENRTAFFIRLFHSDDENKPLLKKNLSPDQYHEDLSGKLFNVTGKNDFFWVISSIYSDRHYHSGQQFFHVSYPEQRNIPLHPAKKETIIEVENIGLQFERVVSKKVKQINKSLITIFARKHRTDYFWALRNISFSIRRGDVLGIIGNNGAGKSTLLKLLIQVLLPDEGSLRINGKVSSLISLGAGFIGDLSGRENIYLNGMYMGMTKNELDDVYNDIVAFSELENFIDTSIKYYSSGMKARLGFSVAVHTKPDILIVDEVLTAGDRKFREKAEKKMLEFMQHAKAIVIVSHSMPILKRICNRCLWLDNGRIHNIGPAEKILELYMNDGSH